MKQYAILLYVLIGLGAGARFYPQCKPATPDSPVCWLASGIVGVAWPIAIGARLWDFTE